MKERSTKNIFVQGPIPPAMIADSIAKHQTKYEIGAHSIFLGQVRADELTQGTVSAIEYTAHEEMALEKMHQLRESIIRVYELTCLHVYHSLGKVPAGEICLFVFTSSRNRKAAIEACSVLVEKIKSELPVWGKELCENGTTQWKVNQ